MSKEEKRERERERERERGRKRWPPAPGKSVHSRGIYKSSTLCRTQECFIEWLQKLKRNNGPNRLCRLVRPVQPIIPFPDLNLSQPVGTCQNNIMLNLTFKED